MDAVAFSSFFRESNNFGSSGCAWVVGHDSSSGCTILDARFSEPGRLASLAPSSRYIGMRSASNGLRYHYRYKTRLDLSI